MTYSIIDIGTNSVRFMLAEYEQSNIRVVLSEKTTTRLGEGLYTPERRLCDKPVFDTLCAVKKYAELASSHKADCIICIATSAVRDASNSAEFARKLKEYTGVTLRILSGEEEAYCGFTGAVGDIGNDVDTLLVDIGGGSTELVQKHEDGIKGVSFECGCVRLRELFGNDYASARKYIESTVKVPACENVVWIGGTATAVAMIYKNVAVYSPETVHMTSIPAEYIRALSGRLLKMPGEQLKAICGFDVRRGEILPYGGMLISHILEQTGASEVTVSEKGLMDGIILLHESGQL